MKVRSVDLAERTIALEQAHRYGLKTGLPYHTYYALNLLEEIDEPGEWYLDRKSGLLYFWPPSDPKTANISVSILESPMVVMEGASYVTLQGITFETSRGMGVYIEQGSDNLIAGCTFRNLGTVAVCMGQGVTSDSAGLNGYILQNGADQGIAARFVPVSRQIGDYVMGLYADTTWNRQAGTNHGIVGCDIYNTGGGGIILSGGDRKTLTPGGNYVLNCHIHHYNRLDWAYRTAINMDGVGNRVTHCLIHDAPLGAIGLYGNDHLIEFNEIHDVCLQADDMAAYYFGRNLSERGNTFRHNFVHHIGPPEVGLYGASAVFFDDGSCGGIVVGNVFYKVQNYAVRLNGGHDHIFRNNIFIESRASIPSGMNNEQWQNYVQDPLQVVRLRQAVDILKPPYSSRYPELANTFETDPNYRRYNIVHDNLSVRSGDFGAETNNMKDNLVTKEDPGFVDEASMNFQLKPDAPVLAKMPGFRPIPFGRIGLYIDEYRLVLPEEARRSGY
ncbi:right-handed parallel beta-helix repeat-containing protein [Candidatus Poribacteria bacterium]